MHTEVACSSPGLGACSCTLPAVPLCYRPLKANKPLLFPPDRLSQGEAHADPDSVAVQVQGELTNHNPHLFQGTSSVFPHLSSPSGCLFCFLLAAPLLPAPDAEGKEEVPSPKEPSYLTHCPQKLCVCGWRGNGM